MNNLTQAKESLRVNTILNPILKTKRIKLPLQRDIVMVENMLNQKLKSIKNTVNDEQLNKALTKWGPEIDQIHAKAILLKKEINNLTTTIEKDTNNTVKIDPRYSHYWKSLPENINDAKEDSLLEITDSNNPPILTTIENEITELLLDIKLGIKPISEVKTLLQNLDNIK